MHLNSVPRYPIFESDTCLWKPFAATSHPEQSSRRLKQSFGSTKQNPEDF